VELIKDAKDPRFDREYDHVSGFNPRSHPAQRLVWESLRAALEIIDKYHKVLRETLSERDTALAERDELEKQVREWNAVGTPRISESGMSIGDVEIERDALRADLAAALAQLAEKEGQVCQMREKLKVACQWLLSAEAITTVALERAFHDINTVAPCRAIAVAAYLKEGK